MNEILDLLLTELREMKVALSKLYQAAIDKMDWKVFDSLKADMGAVDDLIKEAQGIDPSVKRDDFIPDVTLKRSVAKADRGASVVVDAMSEGRLKVKYVNDDPEPARGAGDSDDDPRDERERAPASPRVFMLGKKGQAHHYLNFGAEIVSTPDDLEAAGVVIISVPPEHAQYMILRLSSGMASRSDSAFESVGAATAYGRDLWVPKPVTPSIANGANVVTAEQPTEPAPSAGTSLYLRYSAQRGMSISGDTKEHKEVIKSWSPVGKWRWKWNKASLAWENAAAARSDFSRDSLQYLADDLARLTRATVTLVDDDGPASPQAPPRPDTRAWAPQKASLDDRIKLAKEMHKALAKHLKSHAGANQVRLAHKGTGSKAAEVHLAVSWPFMQGVGLKSTIVVIRGKNINLGESYSGGGPKVIHNDDPLEAVAAAVAALDVWSRGNDAGPGWDERFDTSLSVLRLAMGLAERDIHAKLAEEREAKKGEPKVPYKATVAEELRYSADAIVTPEMLGVFERISFGETKKGDFFERAKALAAHIEKHGCPRIEPARIPSVTRSATNSGWKKTIRVARDGVDLPIGEVEFLTDGHSLIRPGVQGAKVPSFLTTSIDKSRKSLDAASLIGLVDQWSRGRRYPVRLARSAYILVTNTIGKGKILAPAVAYDLRPQRDGLVVLDARKVGLIEAIFSGVQWEAAEATSGMVLVASKGKEVVAFVMGFNGGEPGMTTGLWTQEGVATTYDMCPHVNEVPLVSAPAASTAPSMITSSNIHHRVDAVLNRSAWDNAGQMERALRFAARLAPEGGQGALVEYKIERGGKSEYGKLLLQAQDARGPWSLENPREGVPLLSRPPGADASPSERDKDLRRRVYEAVMSVTGKRARLSSGATSSADVDLDSLLLGEMVELGLARDGESLGSALGRMEAADIPPHALIRGDKVKVAMDVAGDPGEGAREPAPRPLLPRVDDGPDLVPNLPERVPTLEATAAQARAFLASGADQLRRDDPHDPADAREGIAYLPASSGPLVELRRVDTLHEARELSPGYGMLRAPHHSIAAIGMAHEVMLGHGGVILLVNPEEFSANALKTLAALLGSISRRTIIAWQSPGRTDFPRALDPIRETVDALDSRGGNIARGANVAVAEPSAPGPEIAKGANIAVSDEPEARPGKAPKLKPEKARPFASPKKPADAPTTRMALDTLKRADLDKLHEGIWGVPPRTGMKIKGLRLKIAKQLGLSRQPAPEHCRFVKRASVGLTLAQHKALEANLEAKSVIIRAALAESLDGFELQGADCPTPRGRR